MSLLIFDWLISEHPDGGFSWTVVVKDSAVVSQALKSFHPIRMGGFTAKHEQAARKDLLWVRGSLQGGQVGGNNLETVNRVLPEIICHETRIHRALAGNNVEAPTGT